MSPNTLQLHLTLLSRALGDRTKHRQAWDFARLPLGLLKGDWDAIASKTTPLQSLLTLEILF